MFNEDNYAFWVVKIKSYLKAFNLWDTMETKTEQVLRNVNPTIAQLNQHEEDIAKRYKALSCLQSTVSNVFFARIMHLQNLNEVCDHLKDKFYGSECTCQI